MRSASASPEPKTTCVRPPASGQRVQPAVAAARPASSSARANASVSAATAPAATASAAAGLLGGAVSREHGELLAHVLGAAVRTVGVVPVPDELLEVRLALHADVLVDRHRLGSLGRGSDRSQMWSNGRMWPGLWVPLDGRLVTLEPLRREHEEGLGANVEAKYLLLRHAFEALGCRRVEFKTDAKNDRARGALAALPAEFEGIHRKHMLVRGGERRDSAWYAVVDDEWPEVKAALEERLRPHVE